MKMKFKKNKHEHEVAETPDQIMEDTAAEELETLDEREPEILDDVSASDDTEIHGRRAGPFLLRSTHRRRS